MIIRKEVPVMGAAMPEFILKVSSLDTMDRCPFRRDYRKPEGRAVSG